ncbi:TPA: hypothetical protein ACKPZB_001421 [Serratia marcescens]
MLSENRKFCKRHSVSAFDRINDLNPRVVFDCIAGVISREPAGNSNMALSKEEETQRLILLGAISQLDESERNEIYALKDKFLGVFKTATKPELAMAALGLASADAQK